MAATERTWIYEIGGRLLPEKVWRPSGRGPWPVPRQDLANLVVAVEGEEGEVRVSQPGPRFRADLVPEAVKLHLGFQPDNFDPGAWLSVPVELKDFIALRVRAAEDKVRKQYVRISNEETLTGVLFGSVETDYEYGGWTVRIRHIEFSKHSKEPGTGADLAVVLDVVDTTGRRGFKSIWLQAKRANAIPDDILRLPRLADQIEAMRAYTREPYAVVYTPNGVIAVNANSPRRPEALHRLLRRAMDCEAGDPSAVLLGNSMNREHVLMVLIEHADVLETRRHHWAPPR